LDISTRATAFANNTPRVLYKQVITAAKGLSGITMYRLLADCRHDAYLREYYRLPEHLTGVPCPGMGHVYRHKTTRHLQHFNDPWYCYIPSTFLPAQLSLRQLFVWRTCHQSYKSPQLRQHPLSLTSLTGFVKRLTMDRNLCKEGPHLPHAFRNSQSLGLIFDAALLSRS